MLYKPSPELYIKDWLFCHTNTENREQEISGMNINIHTINTVVDIAISIKAAINEDAELQLLKQYIIRGWPNTKHTVEPGVER